MRKDDIMELGAYFKSIIDQDRAAVVICSLDHKIIYMNPGWCDQRKSKTSVPY